MTARQSTTDGGPTSGTESSVDDTSSEEVLELLGDEYSRRILKALAEESMSAQELRETTGITKVTTYRRLERLEDAGLVQSVIVPDRNGHHHSKFSVVYSQLCFEFEAGRIELVERTGDSS